MSEALGKALDELTVFEPLKDDEVFQAFQVLCLAWDTDQERRALAHFCAALFAHNTENWTEYLQNKVLTLETCLGHYYCDGQALPTRMFNAAMADLQLLSQAAQVSPEDFNTTTPWDWVAHPIDLQAEYLNRLLHIEEYGWGVFAQAHMFRLTKGDPFTLVPVGSADSTTFAQLYEFKDQHTRILENTKALMQSLPAENLLLYGDAGTGKSASIKAAANEFARQGLRLIEVRKDQLEWLPDLMDRLAREPLKFILYIDDLSFGEYENTFAQLKAILEGSVCARPSNIVLYATSNRRHLVKESQSQRMGDDMHRRDTLQEMLSLSQRFGLTIFFERPSQAQYLRLVERIGREYGLPPFSEEDRKEAEAFALRQGGRSARCARQFVAMRYARKGLEDAQS